MYKTIRNYTSNDSMDACVRLCSECTSDTVHEKRKWCYTKQHTLTWISLVSNERNKW